VVFFKYVKLKLKIHFSENVFSKYLKSRGLKNQDKTYGKHDFYLIKFLGGRLCGAICYFN